MSSTLVNDHAGDLVKKLPVLYRKRTLVLMILLAMHLFIVTRYVSLSEEEQINRTQTGLNQQRMEILLSLDTTIQDVLTYLYSQQPLLFKDLVKRFKQLSEAYSQIKTDPLPLEGTTGAAPGFQIQQSMPVQENPFLGDLRRVIEEENPIPFYQEIIDRKILEPIFNKANRDWKREQEQHISDLNRLKKAIQSDQEMADILIILAALEKNLLSYQFTAPTGRWWATYKGKQQVLNENVEKVSKKLENKLIPVSRKYETLKRDIRDRKKELKETLAAKEKLLDQARKSLDMLQSSLNIAAIDGVMAIHYFPVLLAVVMGLLTLEICRCINDILQCRSKVDKPFQADLDQLLGILSHPPLLFNLLIVAWTIFAAFHVRLLTSDSTIFYGQLFLGTAGVTGLSYWEKNLREKLVNAAKTEN